MARIVIIDDEAAVLKMMSQLCERLGHETYAFQTGTEGMSFIRRNTPEILIVDLKIGDMDGLDIIQQCHIQYPEMAIIMVTGYGSVETAVEAMKLGAFDYLTKPFAPKELSARIRALLRRARSTDPGAPQMVFGDLEIIPEEGVVRLAGTDVHLTKTEFRLLVELATNPGRVLSREVLLERVWGYGYFGDGRLVDVHIRRLRTKIEPDPANPRYVVTIRGLGYKLQS